MRGWLAFLATACRLPERDAFAELDMQIDKLRSLRDSYRDSLNEQQKKQATDGTIGNGTSLSR